MSDKNDHIKEGNVESRFSCDFQAALIEAKDSESELILCRCGADQPSLDVIKCEQCGRWEHLNCCGSQTSLIFVCAHCDLTLQDAHTACIPPVKTQISILEELRKVLQRNQATGKSGDKLTHTLGDCENWLCALKTGTEAGIQVQKGMQLTQRDTHQPPVEVKSIRHWDAGNYTTEDAWSEAGVYVELVTISNCHKLGVTRFGGSNVADRMPFMC